MYMYQLVSKDILFSFEISSKFLKCIIFLRFLALTACYILHVYISQIYIWFLVTLPCYRTYLGTLLWNGNSYLEKKNPPKYLDVYCYLVRLSSILILIPMFRFKQSPRVHKIFLPTSKLYQLIPTAGSPLDAWPYSVVQT